MRVELLSPSGTPFRHIHHAGQDYVEAPASGEYSIRLTNSSPHRRLAVLTVDGKNVCDGKLGSYDGAGFVLAPWQSTVIKGYLRGSAECARFTFTEAGGSYAALTGDGVKNTGVIGVAVFDEAPAPAVFVPPTHTTPYSFGGNVRRSFVRGLQPESYTPDDQTVRCAVNSVPDLGTAYGRAEAFHTTQTTFRRATATPAMLATLRYGVTEKLREWGVPVEAPVYVAPTPDAFPASPGYAPPPAGWVR